MIYSSASASILVQAQTLFSFSTSENREFDINASCFSASVHDFCSRMVRKLGV